MADVDGPLEQLCEQDHGGRGRPLRVYAQRHRLGPVLEVLEKYVYAY